MSSPPPFDWDNSYPAAVTVCDRDGTIIAMNRQARKLFARRGGDALIGTSLYDCHNSRSGAMIRKMLANGRPNIYVVRSESGQRLIQQVVWHTEEGEIGGLVETSLPIVGKIPVIDR